MIIVSKVGPPITYKGKIFGIIILVVAQTLIGVMHGFFGLLLLGTGFSTVYSIYTFLYGLLTAIFAYGLWLSKPWGWVGTLGVSGFVIVMDLMTLINMPIISEIPIFAAVIEPLYSFLVVLYLIQPSIRHELMKK